MANQSQRAILNFLAAYHPEIQELALRIREIILECTPDAREKVNLGWRSINYSHSDVGYFCGLFPHEHVVVIAFEWGVLLPDPGGIMTRKKSQVGYVQIGSLDELRVEALKALIQAAVNLPGDRGARLAMVKSGARMLGNGPEHRGSSTE